MSDMPRRALELAERVLGPAAAEVDRTGVIPASHFAALARDGFYGIVAPPEFGGPGAGFGDFVRSVEILAGACMTTTFTWLQHHGVVMGLAMTGNAPLRETYLARAAAGEVRGGGAFSGVVPTPPRVRGERLADGWSISGTVPLVSGWGLVDLLHVSAYHEESGDVVNGLIDAREGPGVVGVDPVRLMAAQGSNTVRLHLDGLVLPDERVTTRVPREQYLAGLVMGLRVDSALALGLVGRVATELEALGQGERAVALRAEAGGISTAFDAAMAEPARLPGLRAAACELAVRSTTALVVAVGGAAMLVSAPAQRLAREALFSTVVASRPEIKSALLDLLVAPGGRSGPAEQALTGAGAVGGAS